MTGPRPTKPGPRDGMLQARSRMVGSVILGTIGLWVLVQFLGARFDWAPRWMVLADLAALGALAWAVIVAVRALRERNKE
jgi:hypothetical protein